MREVDRPVPAPTEVLVRVKAIGLNSVEAYLRDGRFRWIGSPPFTLGWDISGVVEDLEPGVTRFQIGDEVYGMPFFPHAGNAYAEYVVAPSRQLARKPANVDHAHAAGVPLAGLTAYQGLVDVARVQAGQRVLIHAAGGGVGHLAVGIAKSLGAHVIGTASAGKRDFVLGLGADEVIDYRAEDFATAVKDVDVVVDALGGDVTRRSFDVLRPGGLLLSWVGRKSVEMKQEAERRGLRFIGTSVEPDYVGLEALTGLIETGAVRPYVQEAFPFEEVGRAHAVFDSGVGIQGKLVLTV